MKKFYMTTKQPHQPDLAPAGRKLFAPAGTQDLTTEAKACGHEAT